MKQLIIILLLSFSTIAQNELWPTENAEWYYTVTDNMTFNGYSKYTIERDTILDGKTAQVYSYLLEGSGGWGPVSYFEDVRLIIALEDSILYSFVQALNSYDIIMNFKANVGSQWNQHVNDPWCPSQFYLDTIQNTVQNIATENVNGRTLKKYTIKRDHPSFVTYNYTEEFYQQFGANFLFVINYPCTFLDAAVEHELRCFTMDIGGPNEYTYSPFPLNCDYVGIEELNITTEKELIKIIDLMGRETEVVSNTPLIYIYSDGSIEKVFKAK